MRTIQEHQKVIAALVGEALARREPERITIRPDELGFDLHRYLRRRLVSDVVAPLDLPPFDNSQMDGYAVDSAALAEGPASLTVGPRIPAGHLPGALEPGSAAPIMTGAPMPPGADAVVPIEAASPAHFLDADATGPVQLPAGVPAGQFVRSTGSDVRAGSTLLEAGTVLRPAHYGILAASGIHEVLVEARPRVLLISTGAELADPTAELLVGEIHDANGASLAVAIAQAGAEALVARVTDSTSALMDVLLDQGAFADEPPFQLVVTTGGVSAGAYEVVREAFEGRGVEFASVAMQPGGPQGWGRLDTGSGRSIPVVCFPGNPVSALVSFEAFLREPLLRAAGAPLPRRDATAPLAAAVDSPLGKHQIRRGRLDRAGALHLVGGPSSHLLHSYAQSTVLAHIPVGVDRVEAGTEVVVWPLDD